MEGIIGANSAAILEAWRYSGFPKQHPPFTKSDAERRRVRLIDQVFEIEEAADKLAGVYPPRVSKDLIASRKFAWLQYGSLDGVETMVRERYPHLLDEEGEL